MGQSGDPSSSTNSRLFDWDMTLEEGDGGDGDRIVPRDSFEPMPFSLDEENAALFNETSGRTSGNSGTSTTPSNSQRSINQRNRGERSSSHLERESNSDSETDPDADPDSNRKRSLDLTVSETMSINRRSKKPKGMPKRPLSAYNIFFQEERPKIVEAEEEESGSERNLAFEDLGKIIGKRWRALSSSKRQIYEDLAEKDGLRYRKEMEMFSVEKRKKSSSRSNHSVSRSHSRSRSDSTSHGPMSPRQSLCRAQSEPTAPYSSQSMYMPPPPPSGDTYKASGGGSPLVAQQSAAASVSHFPPYSAPATGPYAAFGGLSGNSAAPGEHHALWKYPPSPHSAPPSAALPSAGMPPTVSLPIAPALPPQTSHPLSAPPPPIPLGGRGVPMECLPGGTDPSLFPIPPGMELLLPDRDGRKRKYKVQYTCYSMTSQAAQRYMESLGNPAQTRHAIDERRGLPPPTGSSQAGPPGSGGGFTASPQIPPRAVVEVAGLTQCWPGANGSYIKGVPR